MKASGVREPSADPARAAFRSPSSPCTRPAVLAAAVVGLAAVVYANALGNGLVWDDPIVLTRQLQAFTTWHDVFFPPHDIPQFSPDYYRPLTTMSYLVDRAIGGSGPFIFHLSVFLGHVLATWLVFRLGLALFRDADVGLATAAFGAALFAVHPIHTESVAWGAGRSDVLACVFGTAGALTYLEDHWAPLRRALLAAVLLLAAALAKEAAVPLFFLVPASPLILASPRPPPANRPRRKRRRPADAAATPPLLASVPFAAALLLYVLLRSTALHSILGPSQPLDAEAVATVLGGLALYIGKLMMPVAQCAYISDVPHTPVTLVGVGIGLAAVVGAGVVAWRRGSRQLVWLLLWTGLTLAPSLAIPLKLPAVPVAERYLYVPSVGFCLLVGYGAALASCAVVRRPLRITLAAAGTVTLVVAAVATMHRNGVWHDNLSLWRDTAAKNTTDGLPLRSLATAYLNLGDHANATEYFERALQRRNDPHGLLVIHNNLGSLALQEHKVDEAEGHYETALRIDPNSPDALFNLGLIALTRAIRERDAGDTAATREQATLGRGRFERALQLNPRDPDTHVALGQVLALLDDPAAARRHYDEALRLGPAPDTERSIRRLLGDLQ
jgi:tetratricopeptide (TPR) repeat protein